METLFFRRPRLVALVLLVILAAGASALMTIGRQEDPTITNLFATVTTVYPGAEPSRIEALITEKVENELREIADIAVIESTSADGISIVTIELDETISTAEIDVAWADVREALDDAELEFPTGALPSEFNTEGAGAFSYITAVVAPPEFSMATVQRYAEGLADRIRRLGGTDSVELFGGVTEEVLVEFSPYTLGSLGLTIDQVSRQIRNADAKVTAGRVQSEHSDLLVEVEGEIDALYRIKQIPIVAIDGQLMRVGDIADVHKGIRTPVAEKAYASGRPAILVAARISTGLQIDTWMQDVRSLVDDYSKQLPNAIALEPVFDQSSYTSERLSEVAVNMTIGMLLVVLVLLVTLGIRAAFIVAMVLPLVSLASIATMNVIGLPIHQMSLTGLIVALGLVVDAAIVMTDEIKQRLRDGLARLEAVQRSVKRLFAPLLASTLTTALSFMPMVLLPGPAGDFVGSIAIAVILMLTWSFLIAVTVTAAIAGYILPDPSTTVSRWGNGVRGIRISRVFKKSLELSVRNPASSIALALVLPLMGFLSAGTLTAQFFPGVDRDQFYIELELAAGTALARTEQATREVDELLRQEQGIEQVSWVIGKSAPAFYYNMVADRDNAPQYAQALVKSASSDATSQLVPKLQTQLSSRFPEARILVRGLVQGPPVGAPVEVRLIGPQLETLRELGEELRGIVAGVDAVTTVRTSLEGGAPKVVFAVDEDAARLSGLELSDVAGQLDANLQGRVGGSLLEGSEELPVRVRAVAQVRNDLSSVSDLPLIPSLQSSADADQYPGLPLSSIAGVTLAPSQSSISRRNGERVNSVQAFIQYGLLPEEALKQVQAAMVDKGFTVPAGYRLQLGGDSDERDNTLNNLLAPLGIIITLSIASIVLTFNSFRLATVTLIVSGLSAGLSLLALALFQYPFGINAIIGVIGSIGVSINAAIIILTGLQSNDKARVGDTDAMVAVVMGSSRHIVSTTVTTFGGFLPLIIGGGGFWPPFAMSVAGGVLLSTVVSFYFTPPMFRLVYARSGAGNGHEGAARGFGLTGLFGPSGQRLDGSTA